MTIVSHISYAVRPELLQAETRFWNALGFGRITHPSPKHVGEWLTSVPEVRPRGALYIYLRPNGLVGDSSDMREAAAISWNHVAIVPPHGLLKTLDSLNRLPFTVEAEEAESHWNARRVFVISPSGYRIELLAYAPPARWAGGPPPTD